jgi:ATP-binding cassette subfamily B protein
MQSFFDPLTSFAKDAAVLSQKIKPGTARRMLKFAIPHAGQLLLFAAITVVNSCIGIAGPLIYREIIDEGILKRDIFLIVELSLLVACLGLLDTAARLGRSYLATRISASVVVTVRKRLFEHIQRMPLAFFARINTGALVNRLARDAAGARTAFTDILSNVVGNSVTVALVFFAVLALSWRIALGILLLLPLFVVPARYWGRRIQAVTRESLEASAALSSLMVERFNVAGALLAKLFGRPPEDAMLFERKACDLSRASIKRALYGGMFGAMLMLMATSATALAYGWGGVLAAEHVIDLGTVVALVSLLTRMYFPLMGLSNVQVSVMTALVSFERVFEVLDLVPSVRESPNALPVPPGPVRLTFEHVSFRYPSAAELALASLESMAVPEKRAPRTVLHDIDFAVEPGELVALVGPSGAGKTTITQLATRLYDVETGAIRINGIDLREVALDSLRERVAVVTQEAHLFNDSIRANLLYANPRASEDDLRAALQGAQILELVDALPGGLDTLVGGRGHRFSGGERQRLAIARALLKAPDLIILDEATAHLDSSLEEAVRRSLENVLSGRTALVIAHRLSTVLRADQILVIQDGRIVQKGTHAELAAEAGLYARLYQGQFLSRDDAR